MNPEKKRLWLEALRSGEYKQGRKVLKTNSELFCCLGVYADAVEQVSWEPTRSYHYQFVSNDGVPQNTGLPASMVEREHQAHLIYLNDTEVQTFDQIANWIEENIK